MKTIVSSIEVTYSSHRVFAPVEKTNVRFTGINVPLIRTSVQVSRTNVPVIRAFDRVIRTNVPVIRTSDRMIRANVRIIRWSDRMVRTNVRIIRWLDRAICTNFFNALIFSGLIYITNCMELKFNSVSNKIYIKNLKTYYHA